MMQALAKSTRQLSCLVRNVSSVTRCSRCLGIQYHKGAISQPRYHSTAEVIAPPFIEGQDKDYSPKIRQIVSDIGELTLIEVADLNELLKKTLNISDAPVMAMGAMPAAQAQPEEEEDTPKQAKALFSVKLMKFDAGKKVALIKAIKTMVPGLNLVQAKKFVESAPQDVKSDISKEEAEQLKTALEAVGATVEVA